MSTILTATSIRRRPSAALVIVLFGALGATSTVAHAQNPPEAVEYYATDALGSVRVVFTASGQVLGRSEYLPFGETLNQSGALPRQRFTGQERDGEAGMDYFLARNLQARTGRMNAPDPLFGDAMTNPQRWNRYAYVLNNPFKYTDPSGKNPNCVTTPAPGLLGVITCPKGPVQGLGEEGAKEALADLHNGGQGATFGQEADEPGGEGGGGIIMVNTTAATNKKIAEWYDKLIEKLPPKVAAILPSGGSLRTVLDDSSISLPIAGLGMTGFLQYGGHTITVGTAEALNALFGVSKTAREWGRVVESLKDDLELPNNFHGWISATGEYCAKGGKEVLGYLGDYLK